MSLVFNGNNLNDIYFNSVRTTGIFNNQIIWPDQTKRFIMSGHFGLANTARNGWWNTPWTEYFSGYNCNSGDILSTYIYTFRFKTVGTTWQTYTASNHNVPQLKPGIHLNMDVWISANFRVNENVGRTAAHGYSYYTTANKIFSTKTTATSTTQYFPTEYNFNYDGTIPSTNADPYTGKTFALFNYADYSDAARCGWSEQAPWSACGYIVE